jgi:hypothetical protein
MSTRMPCSFAPSRRSRSGTGAQPIGLLEVTVTIRWLPLVTAAYGTQVARPTRTTMLAPGGAGSQLVWWVRPVLGDNCFVGKPRARRGSWSDLIAVSEVQAVVLPADRRVHLRCC